MYTLYSLPGSCSTGISILLTNLGQPFEVVNPKGMENYLSVSPTGQVPALDDDGLLITEGAAIALYLLEKHGNENVADKLSDKAVFLRWLMFNYATLHPAYSKLFSVNGSMEDSAEKTALMQALADKLSDTWAIVDRRLEDQNFMVGEQATIIDYLLAIYTGWNAFFPAQTITVGDNVRNLVSTVAGLPEFQEAYAKEGNEFVVAA